MSKLWCVSKYLIIGGLVILLAGCEGGTSSNNAESFSAIGKGVETDVRSIDADQEGAVRLLDEKFRTDSEALRLDVQKQEASLRERHPKEMAAWEARRDADIAKLEAQGYKYVSSGTFHNPLKPPPQIVKELAWKHSQDRSALESRHRSEMQLVANTGAQRSRDLRENYNAQKQAVRRDADLRKEKLKRSALLKFVQATEASEIADAEKVITNPFPYDGKTILLEPYFSTMLSRTEALFGAERGFSSIKGLFVASNVPTTLFTEEKKVLIACRVDADEKYEMPTGAKTAFLLVEFLGAFEAPYSSADLDWVFSNAN